MRAGRGILPFRLVRENDYYEFKPVMMKRKRYLIIFGIIVFFWSCAESDLRLEEEQLVISELNLLAGKLKVSDLLVENSPEGWKSLPQRFWIMV